MFLNTREMIKNVIYQLKLTVSQITCHAAKRLQQNGFSHNLALHHRKRYPHVIHLLRFQPEFASACG
jgi:hypothetical protein